MAMKSNLETPELLFDVLRGLQSWQVVIMNNYRYGSTTDYQGKYYIVLATSADEARQVVLDNAAAILEELKSQKDFKGKKTLPRGKAIRITEKQITNIEDGTRVGRMSSLKHKKMFSPRGVVYAKLTDGAIVSIQHSNPALDVE